LDEAYDIATHQPESGLIMKNALLSLPQKLRELIYLHYICGFTQKEVSQIMNVPLPTIKWRNKKALFLLKSYLKDD
jgi:RNA polymerase sigma factor (sigma-70 family)